LGDRNRIVRTWWAEIGVPKNAHGLLLYGVAVLIESTNISMAFKVK
jgi:hypothetical protein